ncbi:hypothetical protein [Streptomyces sp. NPDC003077]|uniref:hypothetical protein n=1 Tax=Streptomyces sp. NPDC003077 TaxID=3154443 RepID=UPI0033A7EA41
MAERKLGGPRGRKVLPPLIFGLIFVVASAVSFGFLPGALADHRAYASASACPAGASRSESCKTTVPGTIKDVHRSGRSNDRFSFLLTERGADTEQRVRMSDEWGYQAVYEAVRPGDEVTLTYWRGEIRTIRFGAVAAETKASPADDWRFPTAAGLGTLCFGLGMVWFAWWQRYRSRSARSVAPWGLVVGVGGPCLLSAVGLLAGMMSSSLKEALLTMAAAVLVAAFLVGAGARGWRRRMIRIADTSDIVPVPPTGQKCVRATLRGNVPYEVIAYDHLVVGDGRPAVTPDPDGRFARKTLPETLSVRRVRALRNDDPEDWFHAYKLKGVVIECRDGDEPVLIVTRRRDASLILGALSATPGPARTGPGGEEPHVSAQPGSVEGA